MRALCICEKPSLMREIKSVYDKIGFKDKIDFIALHGHILTLKNPNDYDSKYESWDKSLLPIFPTMKERGNDSTAKVTKQVESTNEVIDFSKVEIEPLFEEEVDFETFSKSDFRVVKVKKCEAVEKSNKLLKFTLNDGTGNDRIILSGIHAYYEPEELVGKTCVAIVNLPARKMMGIDSCGMLISAVHKEEGEEKLHLLMLDNHIPAGAKLY